MASAAAVTIAGRPAMQIESLDEWFAALTQPTALTELAAVVVCVLLAWLLVRTISRVRRVSDASSILFGQRIIDGVLFPLVLLFFAYAAQALLVRLFPLAVFKLVLPALLALALIRLGVKVLQAAFKDTPLVRVLERTISWIVWISWVKTSSMLAR